MGGLEKEYRYRGGRAKKELKNKKKKIVMDMKKEQQNGMREKVSGKGTGKILRNWTCGTDKDDKPGNVRMA